MSVMESPRHNTATPGNGTMANPVSQDAVAADIGARLCEKLEAAGCRLDNDVDYLERYQFTCVVSRIREVHVHVNLGVQITNRKDDLVRQEKFLDASRRGFVHKAIFIEVDDNIIAAGGLLVASSACFAFLFDRRYNHFKNIGLRIFEDCTFHFFDIEENVRRLQRSTQDPGHRVGQELTGNIIAYFTDKGFGFIETEKDLKFFFHIANVIDDDLRVQLPSYHPGEDIPVIFKFGGSDGKKYPKALDVVIDQSEYEDEDEYEDY